MLLLIGNTDKLQLLTSAAASVDVVASYMDASNAVPPVVQGDSSGTQLTAITTATTTDIVATPAASEIRRIKALHIRNKHATAATDVTVILDRSGTDYELHKVALAPGEALEYIEGVGFFELAGIAESGLQYVRKSAQQSFSSTSFADVTGMGFAIVAGGIYEVEYDVIFRSATVTVGVGVGLNGPASPVSVNGSVIIEGQRGVQTAGAEFSAGFTTYDNATPLSTAVEATGTDYIARLSALIENGPNAGTLALRWRSETATATTVEAGSFGTIKRLA
jgi:hypothetical protein